MKGMEVLLKSLGITPEHLMQQMQVHVAPILKAVQDKAAFYDRELAAIREAQTRIEANQLRIMAHMGITDTGAIEHDRRNSADGVQSGPSTA